MELMDPPEKKMKGTINILGARWGPSPTEFNWDMDEIERLLSAIGIKINAIIAGGCTVDQIRHAREVELNASWCFDWGQKLGDLMQEKFGIPYSKTGQPYGLTATKEWLLGVAAPLGMEKKALEVIGQETREVAPDLAYLDEALSGKTAIIEISEFPGPIRALSLARMAEEFGAHPVVINVHPYTIKERMPSIKFMLDIGINPEIILTKGLFHLGSFRSSKETEDELEAIVRGYDNAIFFGNSGRFPPCPVVNLSLMNPAFQPQYGFKGIKNIAALVRQALENRDLPRSRLFKGMLYGTGKR
jgi:nitrogenase molybdenum-iron protein alpha/beta subunit